MIAPPSRWIEFDPSGSSASGKTQVFVVRPKHSVVPLGQVRWYAPWRRYCFTPVEGTFDAACLRDIATFCEWLMAERRAAAGQRQG